MVLFKKGSWTAEEDALLLAFVKEYGVGSWNKAHILFPNLHRGGKSCRRRYLNHLHPRIRRASITPSEENIILMAHSMLGNQWSRIAAMLPGRSDNSVKNMVNIRLKKLRRHAARLNFAQRAAPQHVYAPSRSAMDVSPETHNHISLPASAYGLSVLPPPRVAMAGMHGTWGCSASSPGRYTALVTGGGTPVMNDFAAGMGACMKEYSAGAGMMSTTTQTFSPMLVTESKEVGPSDGTHFNAAPTSSYHAWATQALLSGQEPRERLSGTGRLPSVQKPFVSFQLSSVQEPLQSLEGSELPSVQEAFQRLSSELPSVQVQLRQADMAHRQSNLIVGDNDLLEAIKLTGYCSSLSNSTSNSPSPASSFHFDDPYLNTLLMGIEAGHELSASTTSSMTSSPASSSASGVRYDMLYPTTAQFNVRSSKEAPKEEIPDYMFHNASTYLQELLAKEENLDAVIESLTTDGIERDLASMVLGSNMWSSMPHVGESAGNDFMPDFN